MVPVGGSASAGDDVPVAVERQDVTVAVQVMDLDRRAVDVGRELDLDLLGLQLEAHAVGRQNHVGDPDLGIDLDRAVLDGDLGLTIGQLLQRNRSHSSFSL